MVVVGGGQGVKTREEEVVVEEVEEETRTNGLDKGLLGWPIMNGRIYAQTVECGMLPSSHLDAAEIGNNDVCCINSVSCVITERHES